MSPGNQANESTEVLDQKKMIWIGMLGFQIVLVGILLFLRNDMEYIQPPEQAITIGFGGVALILFVVGQFLQRKYRKHREQEAKLPDQRHPAQDSSSFTFYVSSLGLFEMCTILGFVLGLLGTEYEIIAVFCLFGIFSTAKSFPT